MLSFKYILCILYLMILGWCTAEARRKTTIKNYTSNICIRNETYNETHIVPFNYTKSIPYKKFCFKVPPVCTHYKEDTVFDTKNITVTRNRTITECCGGYVKVGNTCVPVCNPTCVHGECVKPNMCVCDVGWMGYLCSEDCPPHHFGFNCMEDCPCLQGATCDSKTGHCFCPSGYTGRYCEISCPVNTYGLHCMRKCMCLNDALCNPKDGHCRCQPGYIGNFCEEPCKAGTHGRNCNFDCICMKENTLSCHHVDGTCFCKPGYEGLHCEYECGNLTFGLNCKEKCSCENNAFCDHITGKCLCTPGWSGPKCSEECPEGTFGEGCQYKCLHCRNEFETCDKVSGNCTCPKDKVCSPRPLTPNCTENFVCQNDGKCQSTTGQCDCPPGWSGIDCSKDCTSGINCAEMCNCTDCEWTNGTCVSKSNDQRSGNASVNISSGSTRGYTALIVVPILIIFSFCAIMCYVCFERISNCYGACFSEGINIGEPFDRADTDSIPAPSFSNPVYAAPETINNSELRANNVPSNENIADNMFRISFKRNSIQDDVNANVRRESKKNNRNSTINPSTQQSTEDDQPEQLMDFPIEDIYETIKGPMDKGCEKPNILEIKVE